MRIISGMRRGMKLKAPEGMNTRPTTDRVKESIFNVISFALPATRVLDLFAGSGALGIEAISRYSDFCIFVEKDKKAIELIKTNIEGADFSDKCRIVNSDALSYIENCREQFDLIFLDPPYNMGFLHNIIEKINEKDLLSEAGIIVVETEKGGESVPLDLYNVRKSVTYGKTTITILQR